MCLHRSEVEPSSASRKGEVESEVEPSESLVRWPDRPAGGQRLTKEVIFPGARTTRVWNSRQNFLSLSLLPDDQCPLLRNPERQLRNPEREMSWFPGD